MHVAVDEAGEQGLSGEVDDALVSASLSVVRNRAGFDDPALAYPHKAPVERFVSDPVYETRIEEDDCGLTGDKSFQDWIHKAHLGDMPGARKGGSVIVYDYQGSEVKRYKLTNCWAKSLEIGTLKAGDTSVLTEKLTIAHEGCEPA